MNLRPKDYTAQEQHIQHLLDECGLRYDTQYSFINYQTIYTFFNLFGSNH